LAREIHGALRLPEFARRFVCRTAELTGSRSGLLAVPHEGHFQVAALWHAGQSPEVPAVPPPPSEVECQSAAKAAAPSEIAAKGALATTHEDSPLDREVERALGAALSEFVANHPQNVVCREAQQILGAEAAAGLGWTDCTMVRLLSATGELAGVLCLTGRSITLS